MSKKRGLSLEEKRDKMLEVFYDSQSFFQLKDLEKLGPKKGVISQSVKDVIQSLVDDDLVFKDKIGTSVYFWSLPSRAGNQLRQVRARLDTDIAALKKRESELESKLESTKEGREDSDERNAALLELNAMEKKHRELQEEINKYADNDPAVYESMRNATRVAHESANRWTDNIFALQKWISKKFPEARDKLEELYKEVGITEDFDYVE
ncbi:hypothetical protein M758_5G084000 [Ceratodon purpureus]|uniref:Meiotic nuclear division protein 1 homolog n=1 Tax=Ceratodon purpureus TaxID=3225 RepID=A0A8T0I1V1_CERPU|nr:hypothetical protein KC19_5G090000 [Ceratodon purpureus]KAG0616016.1 hypothetical protein M758_5G084000 [Ceratodon purpureus]